jgi:AraC family transcriptional regulator of adaptative response/methylated-DNA-[protein]-cysteine methyltransferase
VKIMLTESLSEAMNAAPAPILAVRAGQRTCSLGILLVAATSRGICSVALGDNSAELLQVLRARFPGARIDPSDPALEALIDRIVAMVDLRPGQRGPKAGDGLPLDLRGTPFQQQVWRALQEIPAGSTMTYAALARQIGSPRAVRAVGTACGQNPIAIAVPCHRVLRSDGSLGGYRWGLERKQALLDRERARAS